jgi:hypothetical protein
MQACFAVMLAKGTGNKATEMSVGAKRDISSGELSSQLMQAVVREDLVAAFFNRWRAYVDLQKHDWLVCDLVCHVVLKSLTRIFNQVARKAHQTFGISPHV